MSLNWSEWRLEYWAEVEAQFWPSRYLPQRRLFEAVWFGLHCRGTA